MEKKKKERDARGASKGRAQEEHNRFETKDLG